MLPRILTGLILAPLVALLFIYGPAWANYVFFQIVAIIGIHELFKLLFPAGLDKQHYVSMGITALLPAAAFFAPGYWPMFLGLAALAVMIAKLFRPAPIERATEEVSRLIMGLTYGGLLFLFPVLIVSQLRPWILVLAGAVWMGDTMAYFAGRSMGRHKLYPVISPKKTVEGSIGGVIGSALGAWLGLYLMQIAHDPWPAGWITMDVVTLLGVGAICGVVEQVGDLVESMLKRAADIKDSGSLLPGHGGVLDRFDGFLFAAPVLYTLVILLG
jgi:phosphatidate cytidylyltransferase